MRCFWIWSNIPSGVNRGRSEAAAPKRNGMTACVE